MKAKRIFFIFLGLAITTSSFATVPLDYKLPKESRRAGRYPPPPYQVQKVFKQYNYLAEFIEIADFLTIWQVQDSTSPNFGGMIEAEAGDLGDVVQTDNTLEAIWVWSRYGQLTGDTAKYRTNIENAWVYCDSYPAWEEEGAPENYYRNHNCAWALLASQIYCEVYGDTSRYAYGDTSANYISSHPLNINTSHVQFKWINPFVTGWSAGNLYHYGKARGNNNWVDTALVYGQRLIDWVAVSPGARLSDEMWAMSSGTVVWGICNSIFQEDMILGKNWILDNGAYVDTFQPWYNRAYDSFDWDNAWNIAFCNAHYAMFKVSEDPKYLKHHKFLTDLLLSYDTDSDGGIQATTQDPDTEDMTWISCYLALMGLNNLINTPNIDVASICFISPIDSQQFYTGDTIEILVRVANLGLSPVQPKIKLKGGYEDSITTIFDFGQMREITFTTNWTPSPDTYALTCITQCGGDADPSNDTISITVFVLESGVAEKDLQITDYGLEIYPNPFTHATVISFHLTDKPTKTNGYSLMIYDLSGRCVKSFQFNKLTIQSFNQIIWEGENVKNEKLPSGIYFVKLKASDNPAHAYVRGKKLLLLR